MQKFDPQNTVLDKLSSAKYSFEANHKNKLHISKNFHIFWVTESSAGNWGNQDNFKSVFTNKF